MSEKIGTNNADVNLIDVRSLPSTPENVEWNGGYDADGNYHRGAVQVGVDYSSKEEMMKGLKMAMTEDIKKGFEGVKYGFNDLHENGDCYMILSTNRDFMVMDWAAKQRGK